MTAAGALLADGQARLAAAGIDTARIDARLLLAHAAGIEPGKLFTRPETDIGDDAKAIFIRLLDRRVRREPLSYLTGIREFWSLDFAVTSATLIPRPDTETLIELTLHRLGAAPPRTILDIGTGSGCILVSLLREWPQATGVGTDVSADALAVARANAVRHGVEARATFAEGRWVAGAVGPLDLVVSNPPYIPRAEIATLERDVADYEPLAALDGGTDGLDAYRALIPETVPILKPGGWLCVEVGIGQAGDVIRIGTDAGLSHVETRGDLTGVHRAVAMQKTR